MTDIDKTKNCHGYCRYSKQCRYLEGKAGQDPEDCYMYYKIEDIINDTRDIAAEERRIKEEEEREYDE